MGFQRVEIIGNLGRDPELRFTQSGKAVCNFPVAVNERRGDNDVTTWFEVSVWGASAENCEKYLSKGREVFVEGRVSVDTWTDRSDGSARGKLKINAFRVQFLGGGRRDERERFGGNHAPEDHPYNDDWSDQDIPF